MIHLPEQNVTIVTPPHTASGNLHKTLCTEEYGGKWINGLCALHPDGKENHHYAVPIEGTKVYFVCRNPYTRLVGLFLHYEWSQRYKHKHRDYLCWDIYALHVDYHGWFFRNTLAEFLEAAKLTDYEVIKYENIEEDVSEIMGRKVEMIPAYHVPIVLREWYYDQDIVDKVTEWARPDCELFDYEIIQEALTGV